MAKLNWGDIPDYMEVGEHRVKIVGVTDCTSKAGNPQVKIDYKNEKGSIHSQYYPTAGPGLTFLLKVFVACKMRKEQATDTNLLRGCRLIIHLEHEEKKIKEFDRETGTEIEKTEKSIYPKIVRHEQDPTWDREKETISEIEGMHFDSPYDNDPF